MSSTIRALVYFAFAYTCIEGFVINLTYPNVLAYVVKDAAILVAYLALITEQRPSAGSLRKLSGPLMGFALVMLFFLLMPTPVSLLSSLVAIKQRLFYIPLMYVAYFYVRSERDLVGLLRLIAWTAIPTSAFGIYLFFAGPDALRAMGGTYSAIFYSTTGASGISFWRVPGTFTSPGQFSLYLLIQSVLLSGMLFVPSIERRTRLLAIVALVLALCALLVSGTRQPLVIYVLALGLALFYMGRLTKLGIAALAVYAVLAVAFSYFGAGVQDRVGSLLTEENYRRFRSTAFGQVFYARMMESPLGIGLGTATIGGRHFTEYAKIVLVESYLGVIATETGLLGLMVWIWVMIRISFVLFMNRIVVRGAEWAPLWFMTAILILEMIGLMPSNIMIDSSPGNMYFWFLIGVVLRLADLHRGRLAERASAAAPQPGWSGPPYMYGPPAPASWR